MRDDYEISPKQRIRRLMIKDLKRSGIGKEHIEKLGLKALMPEDTDEFMKGEFNVPTYQIPYFNSKGAKTGYSRLRNLSPKARFGSATNHSKKKPLRYLQRANTAPHLYIPTVFDWNEHRREDGLIAIDKLLITEGEKKAIKACLCGIPCVALGGVDSYKSSKRSILLLEEFDEFDFEVTDVEICYDSDLNTNADVLRAMQKLMTQILSKNPHSVSTVYLDGESTDDGKQGLDDFLDGFQTPEEAAAAFEELPRKVDDRTDKLRSLDRELCYLISAGKIYNINDDRYYDSYAALELDYGPKMQVKDPNDERKLIPGIKLWKDTRTSDTWCRSLVFEPGKPKRYSPDGKKHDVINLWKPSDVKPIEGDVTLWLDLVRYIMKTEDNFNWFLQWLAYPFQHPGSKLLQAVFVYSYAQGIGKNFIIEPLIRKIYGSAYSSIISSQLESDYNSWTRCKEFIFGEEIWMSNKRDRITTMGQLKSIISNEFVTINEKYRPPETLKNYAQLYITANQADALALDVSDRRFFVVHAPERKLSDEFYTGLHNWCQEPDSAGKVLCYLQNQVDVSKFNPRANAPLTEDKDEIIEYGRDAAQSMVYELAADAAMITAVNGQQREQQLFSTAEILDILNNFNRTHNRPEFKGSHDSLGRYLSNEKLFPRRRVRVFSSGEVALYALFNKKTWKRKSDEDWIKHYHLTSLKYRERKKLKMDKREKADVIDINTKKKV